MLNRTLACASLAAALAWAAAPPAVWPVDALVKVFPDDAPGTNRAAQQDWLIARNGHTSIQFAIRAAAPVQALEVRLTLPKDLTGQVRRVGYVPVRANPPKSPVEELARSAPGLFPDPLFEDQTFSLPADQTTSYWVTVFSPAGTRPGTYRATVSFRSGAHEIASVPFQVRVMQASVPAKQSLKVTNWLNTDQKHLARFYDLSSGPDRYWEVMGNIGRVLADHKQNVILTPIFELSDAASKDGAMSYDFSRLDRWIDLFTKAGAADVIEGGHLLGRVNGYDSPLTVSAFVVDSGAVRREALRPDDPRAEAHIRSFLPALRAHLEKKGWLDRYVQHVLDEAHGSEPPVYLHYVEMIRAALPGVMTIDAIDQTAGSLGEACDIWVPQLGRFDDGLDSIRQHVRQGKEAWFYTCLFPQGPYLNRFIQQPLLKTRLLHWMNHRYEFTGFLHWGGNYWDNDPFGNTEVSIPSGGGKMELLPAGDAFITYPSREKNSILSSIRLEAMREGIEDYELLHQLGLKNPVKARDLSGKAILSLSSAVRDVQEFRSLHRELLLAAGE